MKLILFYLFVFTQIGRGQIENDEHVITNKKYYDPLTTEELEEELNERNENIQDPTPLGPERTDLKFLDQDFPIEELYQEKELVSKEKENLKNSPDEFLNPAAEYFEPKKEIETKKRDQFFHTRYFMPKGKDPQKKPDREDVGIDENELFPEVHLKARVKSAHLIEASYDRTLIKLGGAISSRFKQAQSNIGFRAEYTYQYRYVKNFYLSGIVSGQQHYFESNTFGLAHTEMGLWGLGLGVLWEEDKFVSLGVEAGLKQRVALQESEEQKFSLHKLTVPYISWKGTSFLTTFDWLNVFGKFHFSYLFPKVENGDHFDSGISGLLGLEFRKGWYHFYISVGPFYQRSNQKNALSTHDQEDFGLALSYRYWNL